MIKLVDMGNYGDLTNEQWKQIEALLLKVNTKRERPANNFDVLSLGMKNVLSAMITLASIFLFSDFAYRL